ncbi:MAG: hypothetical protein ACPGJV_07925 [Bacteriovoracaceae bacterium]
MVTSKEREEKLSKEIIRAAYQTRLGHLRRGQEHAAKNEISKSVENYLTYLKALETYFEVKEENLSPKLFDKQKDLTELLLISHVYWDLAKAYDKNPKTINEARRCLNQFVKFSIGFKYQRLNSDIIRKYIKKRLPRNVGIFKETYEKLRVASKGCYVATYCFGETSPEVIALRGFRTTKIDSKIWRKLFNAYYFVSPLLIRCNDLFKPLSSMTKRFLFIPMIRIILRHITGKKNEANSISHS